MRDFMGNSIDVGDHIMYCPTDRYSGMVHASVLEIGPDDQYQRPTYIKVQPHTEAGWAGREGRAVKLTKMDRIIRYRS